MKILVLHNRYRLAGGEDVVVETERLLLERNGHQVSKVEVSNEAITGRWGTIKAAALAVYSPSSRRLVAAEIDRFRPDVVHVHNFFPVLSPSVYSACRAAGIPVVQTLHNYRLICPNALLFRDGRICEDCLERLVPWPGVVHGCYRASRAATSAVAAMLTTHRLLGSWARKVDAYIALTEFGRRKMLQGGLPAEKVAVKPNFIYPDPGPSECEGEYILYVGRLSHEKGIAVLVDAYVRHGLRAPLKVAGTGPLGETLSDRVQGAGLGGVVQFLGWQDRERIFSLVRRAWLVVIPSLWYEGCPIIIAEAFACGKAVMASDLGAVSELVENGQTGWLVPPGDVDAWAEAIEAAWADPAEAIRRGRAARKTYEAKYTAEANYRQLMAIYSSVLGKPS
jgi:glycosyltransferase involved in cell wall biosynthesis